MARINLAFIQGYVKDDPTVIRDNDDESIKRVMLNLQLSRGFREVGDNRAENRYDVVQLASEENVNTQIMAELKHGDIIRVKGVYTTTIGEKVDTCKHCGRKTKRKAMITFITPIKIDVVGRDFSPDEGFKYITEHKEISNQLYFFGTLMTDPVEIQFGEKKTLCQYQVANGRKYVIKSDNPDIRFDYPWVKSYGYNAKEDKKRLHKGSEVFLDAFLQTRYFDREFVCGQAYDEDGNPMTDPKTGKPLIAKDRMGNFLGCGELNKSPDYTTEIVPYEVEYLANYNTDEILEEEKNTDSGEDKDVFDFLESDIDLSKYSDITTEDEITKDDIKYGMDLKDSLK